MRAHWVRDNGFAREDFLGSTIVASWCPRVYWVVSTFDMGPEHYVTNVTRGRRLGSVVCPSDEAPVFTREYKDLSLAEAGHRRTVKLLAKGRLQPVRALAGHNELEVRRWLHLRAIEWNTWPSFVSLLCAPILFIFLWWPYVVGAILLADVIWASVRYSWVNPVLANAIAILATPLQWPIAIGSAIYLYVHHSYVAGTLALAWPWIVGFLVIPGLRGSIGRAELVIARKIGYADQDATA